MLAGKAEHDDDVDVSVDEGAIRRSDPVITSNPTHFRAIADSVRARLTTETV